MRSNDPAALRDGEKLAALDYAAAYERNTPLILLRTGLMGVFFILAILLLVFMGAVNVQVIFYLYFFVVFVIVVGTFLARRRTVRQVRQFISSDPTSQASAD